MKLICLNLDACNHTQHLSEDEVIHYISSKFHTCTHCSYLMILVHDDYFIDSHHELVLNTIPLIKRANFD